jgi:hypothetical protein
LFLSRGSFSRSHEEAEVRKGRRSRGDIRYHLRFQSTQLPLDDRLLLEVGVTREVAENVEILEALKLPAKLRAACHLTGFAATRSMRFLEPPHNRVAYFMRRSKVLTYSARASSSGSARTIGASQLLSCFRFEHW